jgi:hypothetical protein
MLRFSEVLLLLPVLVLLGVRLRTGRMPTGRMLFWVLMSMLVLGAALAWFGNERALSGHYTPASLQNGQVVPGHGAAPR